MSDNKHLVIENASIRFSNFKGEERKFNDAGDRNFLVVIPDDLVDALVRDGWNIKFLAARDEDDTPTATLKVNVSFKQRPPTVMVLTSQSRTMLTEASVEILDTMEIANIDLIVNPYNWTVNGKTGKTAYLKSIYVTALEDELSLKYATS